MSGAGSQSGREVQHADALRTEQPLVPREAYASAPSAAEVDREVPAGLRAVDQHERPGSWAMSAMSAIGWIAPVTLLAC